MHRGHTLGFKRGFPVDLCTLPAGEYEGYRRHDSQAFRRAKPPPRALSTALRPLHFQGPLLFTRAFQAVADLGTLYNTCRIIEWRAESVTWRESVNDEKVLDTFPML